MSNQRRLLETRKVQAAPVWHKKVEGERPASWLELFYDLVYIAVIVELGSFFHEHLTWVGALEFTLLFFIVWWTWVETMLYVNQFVVDDALQRILVVAQIYGVGNIASSMHDAFASASVSLALAYAGIRAVLAVQYLRAWRSEPEQRSLTGRYIAGFAISALLWALSVLLPLPGRFVLWALGLGVEIYFTTYGRSRTLQQRFEPAMAHLMERFGLLVIVVLGDAFIKSVGVAVELGGTLSTNLFGGLALVLTVCLWWLYFSDVQRVPGEAIRHPHGWVYAHLPLTLALAAFGLSAELLTELQLGETIRSETLIVTCATLSFALIALALLDRAVVREAPPRRIVTGVRLASAALLVGIAFVPFENVTPLLPLGLITGLMILQVLINVWRVPKPHLLDAP